jgi:hypothetical protein
LSSVENYPLKPFYIISHSRKKGGSAGVGPEDLIDAAIQEGLSDDKSEIDNTPVYIELARTTKPQYTKMMRV